MTPTQILANVPDLEDEDIRRAVVYAAALAQDEVHNSRLTRCGSWPTPESRPRPSGSSQNLVTTQHTFARWGLERATDAEIGTQSP